MLIATGMWGNAFERYGHDFIVSFGKYWPYRERLVIYTDRTDLPKGSYEIRQLDSIPGYRLFLAAYADDPFAKGLAPTDKSTWKTGDLKRGYSWSHDAIKWFPQALIPAHVAQDASGLFCWLDADILTLAPIGEDFFEKLIGVNDGAYLGRDVHSDIGFWAVRLPKAMPMVADFAQRYVSGSFLREREFHSAYIWDLARKASGLNFLNLSPGGHGHVFAGSPLGPYLHHRKGGLKKFL